MTVKWEGVFPAVTTKFTEDDRLDITAFLKNVEAQLAESRVSPRQIVEAVLFVGGGTVALRCRRCGKSSGCCWTARPTAGRSFTWSRQTPVRP